jgi:purine-binding chemotaxis protein CheW
MDIQTGNQSSPPAASTDAIADRGGPGTAALTQFISFAIGDDQYGVDIMAVREIKGWSEITHLPKQPDYSAVCSISAARWCRSSIRCRFGQGLTEATPLHVVIVVQIGSRMVGILADRVLDIISFAANQAGGAASARPRAWTFCQDW